MKSYVSSDGEPSSVSTEAALHRISLQAAERELVAFQQRHASDRSLAKAHAMVELAIAEIRKSRGD